jgi:hypothetical protein
MKHIILLLSFVVLCFAGCSDHILITGTVTYEDGSPVKSGIINFDPGTAKIYSGSIKDGKYSTGGQKTVQPIPPGTYKIWIMAFDAVPLQKEKKDKDGKSTDEWRSVPLVPGEYASPDTTPLSFEVKSGGPKTFDIVISKPVEKKK